MKLPIHCFVTTSLLAAFAFGTQSNAEPNSLSEFGEVKPANTAKFYKKPGYSPYAGRNYPERPLWGDQHVHTGWSADAGMGGATLTPEDALRFARGEEVMATSGQPAKLSRPLDWIAVSDHSDAMGVISELKAGNEEMMLDATLKRWHDMMATSPEDALKATMELVAAQSTKKLPPLVMDPKFAKTVWGKKYCNHGEVQRTRPLHGVYCL